jgi:hypothetical protein
VQSCLFQIQNSDRTRSDPRDVSSVGVEASRHGQHIRNFPQDGSSTLVCSLQSISPTKEELSHLIMRVLSAALSEEESDYRAMLGACDQRSSSTYRYHYHNSHTLIVCGLNIVYQKGSCTMNWSSL